MSNTHHPIRKSLRKIKWRLDLVLDKCGWEFKRSDKSDFSFFSQLLNDRLRSSKEIVFVQIGANDGISNDPLYPLIKRFPGRFRGLVVEPLKDKFEELERTYAEEHLIKPVNVAIHNTQKEMMIHRVRPDLEKRLPRWGSGIGSFNSEHHKLSQLDSSFMVAEKVNCISFDDLLTIHKIADLELLVTDTEGYDFEILRNVDFLKHRPTYVHFEHGLTSGIMTWANYKSLVRFMTQHGYVISHEASDATAFLPSALGDTEPDSRLA